jgi:hypothetical protein
MSISTKELMLTLLLLEKASTPPTPRDAYWLRGAIDVVTLLIKKSEEA